MYGLYNCSIKESVALVLMSKYVMLDLPSLYGLIPELSEVIISPLAASSTLAPVNL